MFNPKSEGYAGPILIEVGRINPRPACDVRVTSDTEAIERYSECLADLPPLLVVADENDVHWLADGRHRFEGYVAKKLKTVPCLVKRGTYVDAYRDACHANETHGVRTTNADKRRRVELALKHPEMKGWSNPRIAEMCGVSHMMVSRMRPEQVEQSSTSTTTGKDGKSYPSTRKGKGKSGGKGKVDHAPYMCEVCCEEFSAFTWHCPECDGHFGEDVTSCPVCAAEPEPPPGPTEPERRKESTPESAPCALPETAPDPPPVQPKKSDWKARFDPITAFDPIEDDLLAKMEAWPKEHHVTFVFSLQSFTDKLRARFGIKIEVITHEI